MRALASYESRKRPDRESINAKLYREKVEIREEEKSQANQG